MAALFITGTGTGLGKTSLSLAVLAWAARLRAAYYKPVQCGAFPFGDPPVPHGDADWLRAQAPEAVYRVGYRLRLAASPHLAAEREGLTLDLDKLRREIRELESDHDLVVMEGAGGAAVPLNRQGATLAHLAADLRLPCLLACSPGLGTLHHTLTTCAYLQALGASVAGFAFVHREEKVPELARDNADTLQALTGMDYWGALPYSASLAAGRVLTPEEVEALALPLRAGLDRWSADALSKI